MKRNHLQIHLLIVGLTVLLLLSSWLLGWLDFFRPWWLLAFLGLPFFSWQAHTGMAGLPSRTNAVSATTRCFLFILVVVALADIQYVLRSKRLAVYFLMDYSASIPEPIRERQLRYVNKAADQKNSKDLAGIIVFGENPSIEYLPNRELEIDSLHSVVNPNYTNMQAAVELAVAAFPANARKKIVLISDGNQNAGNVMDAVRYAGGEGIEVAVLPVTYDISNEVLMEKLQLPEKVKENEPFDLRVHVKSLQETDAELRIYRNGQQIGPAQNVHLQAGDNRYFVELQVEDPNFYVYTARISTPNDSIPDNNEASNYVYVHGEAKALFVTPEGGRREIEHLLGICRDEGLQASIVSPDYFPTRFSELIPYDCIILANVPAHSLSENQMTMVKTSVRDLGTGLIMLGGEDSFGAGGYEQTPIEDALPVAMDIRQKKILPKGALVLILHTCEFPKGNYWAKKITKAAIDTVSPRDDVGVIYFGSTDTWLFPLREASNKAWMKNQVDKCEPGDMPSFAPAFSMATKSLVNSDAMVRHVIVISDGDPARPAPADIQAMANSNVTVSTVGINPHSERDVDVLKYIALKTRGRYYFVKDPRKLPQIFTKEARVVKRSLIFNKPFQPLLAMSSELTKGIRQEDIPQLLAYVATTPKERAIVSMTSDNKNKDPVLIEWRYGLGKAVAFTSDASSNWGRHWVGWNKYRRLWGQVFRWVTRKREKSNLTIRSQQDGDKVRLTIDAIGDRGQYLNFDRLHARRVGSDGEGQSLDVRQIAAGRYQTEFTARDAGVNVLSLSYTNPETGEQSFVPAGVALPYSAEFKELSANLPLLRRVAQLGQEDGRLLNADPEQAAVFQSALPPSVTQQPVWEYLLVLVLILFLADIILRRVIITREDLAAAAAAAKLRLGRGTPSAEHDDTMAALLKRKEQVFDQDKKPRADETAAKAGKERAGQFKRQLQEQVQAGSGGEAITAEKAEEEHPAAAAKKKQPHDNTDAEHKSDGEQAYTSRLLDAKRRARKSPDNDENTS